MSVYGTKVIDIGGRCVAQSHNLRAMLRYAARSPVSKVVTSRDPKLSGRGVMAVRYSDGCQCVASFASFNVMIDFVRARRSWRGAEVTHLDGDMGYLTKPGIIAGDA